MLGASGYRFVIGFMFIILCMMLWIPLNYVFALTGNTLNSMITDAEAQGRNATVIQAYFYTLLIVIIATVIWIIKPDKGQEQEVQYVVSG